MIIILEIINVFYANMDLILKLINAHVSHNLKYLIFTHNNVCLDVIQIKISLFLINLVYVIIVLDKLI